MTSFDYLEWFWLNIKRIRFGLFGQPIFTLRLLYKRIGLLCCDKFVGETIQSPLTKEWIFNTQSLISYWAMHCIKELGTEWEAYIREAAAPVVVDVGSNLGQFRSLILSLNPGAQVTTIDAWKEMSAYVPYEHHVCSGVGRTPGIRTLYKDKKGLTASTIRGVYEGESVTVLIKTLDSIWNYSGPVDLLKMDIDGAEIEALQGAQEMLKKTRVVIIETDKMSEVMQLCPGRVWTSANNLDWIGILK